MTSEERRDSKPTSVLVDRRRSPRLEVLEGIQGKLRPMDIPLTLLNLSDGGFMMQVPHQFQIGDVHEFRFTLGNGEPIVLSARVIHKMRASAGGVTSYVVGLEFVDCGTVVQRQAIAALVAFVRG
jgi:hypothetical protein